MPLLSRLLQRCRLLGWLCALASGDLAVGANAPLGGSGELGGFSFQTWQTEHGLPQNHCTAVVQTRDGYLWLGTYNGLVRFDGARFTVMNTANTPGLHSSRITCLAEDQQGVLWIGHDGGELSRMADGRFEPVSLGTNWSGGNIIALSGTPDGDVWLLHQGGGVVRLRDLRVFPPDPAIKSPTSVSLSRGADGQLYLLHGGKAFTITSEGLRLDPDLNARGEFLTQACPGRSGSGLWVAANGRLGQRKQGGAGLDWRDAPWGGDYVTAMRESRSRVLWVGTQARGVFALTPEGRWLRFSRTNGLNHDWVRCLGEDSEGSIWIGTGGGLCVARSSFVSMVKPPEQLQGRTVLSIHATPAGALWLGTEGAGVLRWEEGRWRSFGTRDGLENLFVWSVVTGPPGTVWAATWGNGLFQLQGERFVPAPGLAAEQVAMTALCPAADGSLWIGTQKGLLRLREGKVDRWAEDWVRPDVRAVAQTRDGSTWFGMSGGGLGRWNAGELRRWTQSDGLSSDYVWAISPDPEDDQTLWIGTFGAGLCRMKAGRFATLGEAQGLPNSVITHVVDDGLGYMWFGSHAGILRARKEELIRCADGLVKTVSFYSYGKADGMTSTECSGGLQPAGCRTPDGRLWFPTTQGAASVDPRAVQRNTFAPPVLVEQMLVDGSAFPISGPKTGNPASPNATILRVPPGNHRFEFRFTAPAFSAPDRVRYRYRLDSLESDWVESGSRPMASYGFLAPGDYTFRVLATLGDGVWSDQPAIVRFTQLPRFWERWWFRVSLGAGLLGGVGLIVYAATRRRYRRELERLERQRAVERERARIAKDIHDDLGASLTRITLLSQTARGDLDRPENALIDIDRIHATACELTKAMDEIVWAVNPLHDSLDSLVSYLGTFAQQFLRDAGIRCRLDVPLQLPGLPLTAEIRHNLFLAFKEVLNNVAKHAHATEVRVSLRVDERTFDLEVVDNGRGFEIPQTLRSEGAPGSETSHHGIRNVRQRLSEMGGGYELSSEPGCGTRVRLLVPFPNSVRA
ncbi:MAG: hypothetical protein HYR88_10710 [Verrucomicrobia bacterium]|nr:hypothetical protein [Verrucomicrobiota bacterium]MBI3869539.1 hypothetical protein [Verrucomicrobiota bacterium]